MQKNITFIALIFFNFLLSSSIAETAEGSLDVNFDVNFNLKQLFLIAGAGITEGFLQ